MSCMMTSPEVILTIAETIARTSAHGYEVYGVGIPESMYNELRKHHCHSRGLGAPYVDVKPLAELLYRLNLAAYNGRYPEHQSPDALPDFDAIKPAFTVPRCEYNQRCIYTEEHYRFVGALDFLVYQCYEDANRGNPILHALEELSNYWKSAIVAADARYRYGGI